MHWSTAFSEQVESPEPGGKENLWAGQRMGTDLSHCTVRHVLQKDFISVFRLFGIEEQLIRINSWSGDLAD